MPLIYLIGARGCGKTTVGKLLAARLGWQFHDLDAYLCKKQGQSVAEIVQEHGWEGFRKLETEILKEASQKYAPNAVLATGGGVVLAQSNRAYMATNGLAVWLEAPAQILYERLCANPLSSQRPGLTNLDLLAEIETVLKERKQLYETSCQHRIDGANPPEIVCAEILKKLKY